MKAYPIPAEAEKVEIELKKKRKELANIKTSTTEELEAKEQMIASYEGRLPRYPADLISEENEAVSAKREQVQTEIKSLEERLEILYPESVRLAYQEE